jgi:hypothetical protein
MMNIIMNLNREMQKGKGSHIERDLIICRVKFLGGSIPKAKELG